MVWEPSVASVAFSQKKCEWLATKSLQWEIFLTAFFYLDPAVSANIYFSNQLFLKYWQAMTTTYNKLTTVNTLTIVNFSSEVVTVNGKNSSIIYLSPERPSVPKEAKTSHGGSQFEFGAICEFQILVHLVW